jgi:hypothetical protein
MRKIKTKEEQERKRKRNMIIMGVVLILIMGLSTIEYSINRETTTNTDNSKKISYNGITFSKQSGYWFFNYGGYQFSTVYNPKETEDISFIMKANLQTYSGKPLYFVGDYPESFSEINKNLNRFVLREQMACILGENCSEELPIKNCSEDNLIIIKEPIGNENEKIYQNKSCVFIISSYSNQTRYIDSFLFNVLGI